MINDENLCNALKLVEMNEIGVSSDAYPVIGTQSLSTCVGLLLYNEIKGKSIVCHCSTNYEEMIYNLKDCVCSYGFDKDPIKYLVIPGFYGSNYSVDKYLEIFCQSYPNFKKFEKKEISSNAIMKSGITPSVQFAFDSRSGKFVTDKVLFGLELIKFYEERTKRK